MGVFEQPAAGSWGGLALATAGADVHVLGVPFDGGAGGRGGAAFGPARVRELSPRMKTTSRRGQDLRTLTLDDRGNLAVRRFDLEGTIAGLHRTYIEIFGSCRGTVLTFGGDHSITYPIVRAAATGKRLGLVWFDAHPDVLDSYLGSPISHGSPLRRIIESGAVTGEDVVLVGTRAYDDGEVEFVRSSKIRELRALDFEEDVAEGIASYRTALEKVAARVDALYVSIDIDVLDAALVTGTGTPVAGGLGVGLLLRLLEEIPEPVAAYDIVEFAPPHDGSGTTDATVLALTTAVLARVAKARETRAAKK